MPLFKGGGYKSAPGKVIAYITNPDKAALVNSQALDASRSYAEQFRETGSLYQKGSGYDERKYYHFKFSCDPVDRVTPEQSQKMAERMAARSFPGYECVIATHIDKPHIHSHIIVNAISFEDGKKLHINHHEYGKLKDRANEIAQEHDCSSLDWRQPSRDRVTSPEKQIKMRGGIGWKEELKDVISEAVRESRSFIEFRNHLEKYGVTIQRNTERTISFKHPDKKQAIRGERLGEDYTKGAIVRGIDQQGDRRAGDAAEPTADRYREDAGTQRVEPGRVRKRSVERELDGVHGVIRKTEEGAKRFSATGRRELTERAGEERRADTADEGAGGRAEGRERGSERRPKPKASRA
jgi:hypothetical protein